MDRMLSMIAAARRIPFAFEYVILSNMVMTAASNIK
jgi:hypothetical protein